MPSRIIKAQNEYIFECSKCSTIWAQSKDSCKAIPHDGMVNGITYIAECPICGKEISIFRIQEEKE